MEECVSRQFLDVSFQPWERRTYCYHNDGEPLDVGDKAVVMTKRGEQTVVVNGVRDEPPKFETKPILRKADDNDDE